MKSHQDRWFLLLTLLACAAGLHAQPTFSSLTMLNPGGSNYAYATAINASGQVLVVDDDNGNLYLWSSGSSTQIPNAFDSGSVYTSYGRNLNDSGQVTGYAEVGEDYRYFIWSSGGGTTEITTESISSVRGLNNLGQVAGQARGEPDHAFTWSSGGGTTHLVNSAAEYGSGYAKAINDSGQVAGTVSDGESNTLAVRWEANGDMTVIATLGLGYVSGINNAGHVIGGTVDGGAFYWNGTDTTFIGALEGDDEGSDANAINASGDIVGSSEGDEERAFLFTSGTLYALDDIAATFLVENGGATAGFISLDRAYGINDSGHIVGQGLYYDGIGDTFDAAFLLSNASAIPEPSTYAALAGLCALGAAAYRRRRTG